MENDFLSELGLNAVVTRMKRVSDAMLHDGKRMYKQLGMDIEPNWFAVFKLLRKHERMTVTEIADAIGLSHPSVISIVNKMMIAGYLKESRSKDDSRKRILSLTPKADRKMPQFEQVWDAGTAGFKKMMHDTDLLGTLDLLERRIGQKGFRARTLEQLERIRSVEITEFDDKYAADFARLNYEWISKYYTIEEHDHDQLDHPRQYIIERGGQIFFALTEAQVAGTVALIRVNYDVLELAKMAVSPEFQGYKIGEKLMEACVEYARRADAKCIFLESNTKQFAAINLYRKFGFVETPLDPNSQFVRANIRMELAVDRVNR
ncbi:MAG TPA: bifunctional helix-turn-helix transcriptional regulator/GNAT family N-acetyltransferase [Pyrinomonadaceae bacterium]|nr:bifunctional helix-turn-helix transcriptional regulator/GNAT family N-acetyltransferase [Pyrinomonadaceae bacterium]